MTKIIIYKYIPIPTPTKSVDLGGNQETCVYILKLLRRFWHSARLGTSSVWDLLSVPPGSSVLRKFSFYHNLVSSGVSTSSFPGTTLAKVIITAFSSCATARQRQTRWHTLWAWNTSNSWFPHVGLSYLSDSSFSVHLLSISRASPLQVPCLELWLGSLFCPICTLLLGDPI